MDNEENVNKVVEVNGTGSSIGGSVTLACRCAADGEAKMVVRSGLKTEVS